jgi:hypothetical protein
MGYAAPVGLKIIRHSHRNTLKFYFSVVIFPIKPTPHEASSMMTDSAPVPINEYTTYLGQDDGPWMARQDGAPMDHSPISTWFT